MAEPLTVSLLPFRALNVVVVLLSMEGQKALRFHQKQSDCQSDCNVYFL